MSTGIILALLGVFFLGWFVGTVVSVPTGTSITDSARESAALAIVGLVLVMVVALTRFFVLL